MVVGERVAFKTDDDLQWGFINKIYYKDNLNLVDINTENGSVMVTEHSILEKEDIQQKFISNKMQIEKLREENIRLSNLLFNY